MSLKLRPLEHSDFPILHDWLNAPHLYPYYMQDPITRDALIRKFSPRVGGGGKIQCVIAEFDKRPFGYMQWYLNRDFPDDAPTCLYQHVGVSIDYFIGDPAYLGRQLGSEMLRELVARTCTKLDELDRIFHIVHDEENSSAIRCTKRAGFLAEESYMENEKPFTLLIQRHC